MNVFPKLVSTGPSVSTKLKTTYRYIDSMSVYNFPLVLKFLKLLELSDRIKDYIKSTEVLITQPI